jgi:hypothetical protein
VKALDPDANTQTIKPPKVGWWWPAIDSQYVIDVLIGRCFGFALLGGIFLLIGSIFILMDPKKFFSEFSLLGSSWMDLSWGLIGMAVLVANIFYLRRYSRSPVLALVAVSMINFATLILDPTPKQRLVGFFDVAITLWLTMINVNAMRAIFAYHNAHGARETALQQNRIYMRD